MNSKVEKLKKQYEDVVAKYILFFCEKQDLEFEFWVGNKIGETASFGDVFYINFNDIILDINTNQKKGLIIKWLYENIDNIDKPINYNSYIMGLRHKDI
jgi:hypothetical protein